MIYWIETLLFLFHPCFIIITVVIIIKDNSNKFMRGIQEHIGDSCVSTVWQRRTPYAIKMSLLLFLDMYLFVRWIINTFVKVYQNLNQKKYQGRSYPNRQLHVQHGEHFHFSLFFNKTIACSFVKFRQGNFISQIEWAPFTSVFWNNNDSMLLYDADLVTKISYFMTATANAKNLRQNKSDFLSL